MHESSKIIVYLLQRHRRALKHDMYWFTNARRHNQQYGTSNNNNNTNTNNGGGVLRLCAPNPSVAFIYRRASSALVSVYRYVVILSILSIIVIIRRGTLADPTHLNDEQAIRQIRASCFLLVPLMPTIYKHRRRAGIEQMPSTRPGADA